MGTLSEYLSESINPILTEIFSEDKFVFLSQTYDEAHFGNAIADYEHKNFRIRVIRDRGQLFIEIAPKDNSGAWYWLPRLFEYLNLAEELEFIEHDLPCMRRQLQFLSYHVDQVKEIFENFDTVKFDLDKFEQKKGNEILDKLMRQSKAK